MQFREQLLAFSPEFVFFCILPKNIRIKIQRPIIWPVISYGFETWCVILREEPRPRV
jgi:hypothetical protein